MFELLVFVVGVIVGVVYHAYLNPYVQLLFAKVRNLLGKKES